MRPIACLLILASVAFFAVGCLKKASIVGNEDGSYLLMTTAGSIEQAMTRFERSAEDVCAGSYRLSHPAIVATGAYALGFGGSTTMTVQTRLTCD